MKRCSITEYEDETIVEIYTKGNDGGVQYSFGTWEGTIESLPNLDEIQLTSKREYMNYKRLTEVITVSLIVCVFVTVIEHMMLH